MHGDRHLFGLLATHWHGLTKKHKPTHNLSKETGPKDLEKEDNEEGLDLFLWSKCFEICEKTHGDTLPCLTVADFNAFLTSHTQNFVTKGCGALALYNEIFGKQDLQKLILRQKDQTPRRHRREKVVDSDSSTLVSSEIGGFLDDTFILSASHSIAKFLEVDFENPLDPVFCNTSRKREAFNAIKYYIVDVDYSCLSIPAILRRMKLTLEMVEEFKTQVYKEGTYLVLQDIKDGVAETARSSSAILTSIVQIIRTIDSGTDLLKTLLSWASCECAFKDVHQLLYNRHTHLMSTVPFNKIKSLKSVCDYLLSTSQAMAGVIEELENISSDSLSIASSSVQYSSVLSDQDSDERPLVVDLSIDGQPESLS